MKLGEDKFGLDVVWNGLYDVYREVAAVCARHSLRHYVTDGCALGAVRHGGFIPWDDDFDISMPRPDYEEFLKIAADELPDHLKVVTWRNTPEFPLPFAKVQDARRDFVERLEAGLGASLSNGIYIDILPIDGTAGGGARRFLHDRWFRLRRVLMRFHFDRLGRQTGKGRLYWLAGMALSPLFPHLLARRQLLSSYERSARRFPFDDSALTIRPCSNVSYRRAPIPREVWGTPREARFGDGAVMVPERVKEYLTFEYGDYMRLPPEDRRRPSHQYQWLCPWRFGPTTNAKP